MPENLIPVGGPVDGVVLDGIVQEIDIETGKVLFEWHSLEHVGLEESYLKPNDYFHINSIDVYDENHLLISSRSTCTVYKVDRKTGEIVWRLGGKKNDFEMGPGTTFAFQHDVRRHPDGIITIFSNGNVFVGWGSAPVFSEFSYEGVLLFSAAFPTEGESYRAFRFPGSGQSTDEPAVATESGSEDEVTLYASWNGATEVTTWQVLAGSGPDKLEPLGSAPRLGFETVITLHTTEPYVGLKAMNDSGKALGTTSTIKLEDSA